MSIQTEPIQQAEWVALGDFLEEVARRQDGAEFERSLEDWEVGMRRYLDTELHWMGTHDPDDEMDLRSHGRCVRALLGTGEQLVEWSKEFNAPLETQRQIAAGVEILRDRHDAWHHGRPEEELERIRGVIFGAEA